MDLVKITTIMCICFCVISNTSAQDGNSFIATIKKEAQDMERNKTEYETYENEETLLFQKRELDIQKGMHVFYRPDLATINAPLAYYYSRLEKHPDRCSFYLEAIASSEDIKNRQQFVLYLKSNKDTICNGNLAYPFSEWNYYISISGNADWANHYVAKESLSDIGNNYKTSLSYMIINHWADELISKNKTKAYAQIKSIHPGNPSNQDMDLYRLYYKLNPIATQNELVEYWNIDPNASDYYCAALLSEFRTKNILAANTLLKIRSELDLQDTYLHQHINTSLFFLNPALGEKEMTVHLENEILGQQPLEDVYIEPDKILMIFSTDVSENKDKIQLLTAYITSDPIHVFGDVNRYAVLKAIHKNTPKLNKKIITALQAKSKEKPKGRSNTLMQWVIKDGLDRID